MATENPTIYIFIIKIRTLIFEEKFSNYRKYRYVRGKQKIPLLLVLSLTPLEILGKERKIMAVIVYDKHLLRILTTYLESFTDQGQRNFPKELS